MVRVLVAESVVTLKERRKLPASIEQQRAATEKETAQHRVKLAELNGGGRPPHTRMGRGT